MNTYGIAWEDALRMAEVRETRRGYEIGGMPVRCQQIFDTAAARIDLKSYHRSARAHRVPQDAIVAPRRKNGVPIDVETLRAHIKIHGTQRAVADASGISDSAMHEILRNGRASPDILERIAKALGVTPNSLRRHE